MKKLAIVGSHPDTRDNAPWNNPEYDIWVFNEAAMANPTDTPDDPDKHWCKRWDVAFQLHKPEIYQSPFNRSNANYWAWLRQTHNKPIYMQQVDAFVPDSVKFPLDEAVALMGEKYFTSSFSYAMALAILQEYKHIELFGADLTSNTEYTYQADCLRAWIMYARGRGINVVMKCWPNAFIAPLYGYEGEVQLGQEYYKQRSAVHNNAWQAADKRLTNLKRAIEKQIDRGEWERLKDTVIEYRDAAVAAGNLAGAMSEAERYMAYGDRAIYRQEYEYNMARASMDGDQRRNMIYHTSGMIEYVWNVVSQSKGANTNAIKQMTGFIWTMGRHAYDTGAMKGVYEETAVYMGLFDGLIRAAGGKKSLESVTGKAE